MRTLKILGFFLTYPTQEHGAAVDECVSLLMAEKWLSSGTVDRLARVLAVFKTQDLMDLQENYVALFDRTPSLSLHLFEHIHGDSRDRGQALVDLMGVYQDAGLQIGTEEMPDYLPLFAEYASTLPPAEASDIIGSVVTILSSLAARLENRQSFYADIIGALAETAARAPDATAVAAYLQKNSGKALDFAEMDSEWEEQFAFENTPQTTGAASCPKAEDMLARIPGYQKEERV